MPPSVQPWERQLRESSQAYGAFLAYRDLGPARSLRNAAKIVGKSETMLGRWSSLKAWGERCLAWDRHHDKVEQDAKDRARAEESARWERRRLKNLESYADLADRFRLQAKEMLDHPLTRKVTDEFGEEIIEPAKWVKLTARDFAKLAFDMDNAVVADALADMEGVDVFSMTIEQCRELVAKNRAKRDAIEKLRGKP